MILSILLSLTQCVLAQEVTTKVTPSYFLVNKPEEGFTTFRFSDFATPITARNSTPAYRCLAEATVKKRTVKLTIDVLKKRATSCREF